MSNPLHHIHKRKIIHQRFEPYPHPIKWKKILDKVIYAAGIAGPVITIPQIIEIWINQNAQGVSLISWSGYLVLSGIWLLYGFAHREKPLIVMYTANIITQIFVVIGIILYR